MYLNSVTVHGLLAALPGPPSQKDISLLNESLQPPPRVFEIQLTAESTSWGSMIAPVLVQAHGDG